MLVSVVGGWFVSYEPSLSDHNYIVFFVKLTQADTVSNRKSREINSLFTFFINSILSWRRRSERLSTLDDSKQAVSDLQGDATRSTDITKTTLLTKLDQEVEMVVRGTGY